MVSVTKLCDPQSWSSRPGVSGSRWDVGVYLCCPLASTYQSIQYTHPMSQIAVVQRNALPIP